MRRLFLVGLLASGAAAPSVYSILGGSVGFVAPDGWREVARTDTDSSSFVAFVVPRPADDPTAPAGNVMIDIALSHGRLDLKAYSEGKVAQVASGPGHPVVADSHYWPDSTRTVLWSARLRGTPYVLWDKQAVRDSLYIDIRTALPVRYATDSLWKARYDSALDTLIGSVCAGAHPLFPGSTASCPSVDHILPFSPDENADGARYVWLIERENGFPRPYVAAKDLPSSPDYTEVDADSARSGDVVWWPTLVGFLEADSRSLALLEGLQPLASVVKRIGKPHYYRRLVPR